MFSANVESWQVHVTAIRINRNMWLEIFVSHFSPARKAHKDTTAPYDTKHVTRTHNGKYPSLCCRYEYIALLDIDEVIMPLKHTNWEDMMKEAVQSSLKVKNETRASWNFRPIYFLDRMLPPAARAADIPAQLHMLQHVYRSGHHLRRSEDYGKTFLNPERVLLGDIITLWLDI